MQELPDAPEEDPDVRGGGQAHDEARIVKDGYDSDEEADDGRGARRVSAVLVRLQGAGLKVLWYMAQLVARLGVLRRACLA